VTHVVNMNLGPCIRQRLIRFCNISKFWS